MTNHDLFTACSGALYGDEKTQARYIEDQSINKVRLNKTVFGKRRY
jgi:hypothetical protein